MDLCDAREIRDLLSRHGFRFSRSMGQNFLIADWVPRRIAEEAGIDGSCGVLEIGPGVGPLTAELAARAGQVIAVELDGALLPVLDETLAGLRNVEVVHGDILKLELDALVSGKLAGLRPVACANLPYSITTPAITKLLACRRFSSVTVMIQREAAERICARPGMADYGQSSLFCQYHARCEILFQVPPSCFLPPPKVTSAVLRMAPHADALLPPEQEKIFLALIRAAFAQRRKTLLNALSPAFGSRFPKEELRAVLSGCGFPEGARGEKLSLEEFLALAQAIWQAHTDL